MATPLHIFSPYPLVDKDGTIHDGLGLRQADYCAQKCRDRVCRNLPPRDIEGGAMYHTCPHGFSVVAARVGHEVIRVNGVVEVSTNKASKEFRKRHKSRKLKAFEFETWLGGLGTAIAQYDDDVRRAAVDSIGALHEIKSIIGTLIHSAENWIWRQPGDSFDDKIEKLDSDIRNIYQSCRILESLLQMTDVLANPASAAFGKPFDTSIYGMVRMLTRVYEARAAARGINIQVRGSSFNRPRVYKSFIIVPLVLLDNAIKYADKDTNVVVTISDRGPDGVYLEVSSFGPLVPENERGAIFDRGYRGANVFIQGSGIGLYVGQQVAHLHGTSIGYGARGGNQAAKGANDFSVFVSDVQADR